MPEDHIDAYRRKRLETLRQRVQPLIEENPEFIVSDLTNLTLDLLAKRFTPSLSDEDKLQIKQNYSDATDALIRERAMSKDGVVCALIEALMMTQIALDYFPDSNCKSSLDNDASHAQFIQKYLVPQLGRLFWAATLAGMSPFGVAATMIHAGVSLGTQHGATWPQLMRPLLDGIHRNINAEIPPD
ncbi:hypothetical protein [Burkholderia stabilis]|uniref:hypothetical protein n=1 Tax=Burkholderia stabilis TaxID=95485 RepID=UPI001F4B3413|nr:hypothetical protein [Burkholderia stabilis]